MDHLSMGVSNMKKFLINIAIFFAIVAVVDFFLGKVFHYLQANIAKGGTQSEYHICTDLSEDILVMGSSRAAHHYVSQLFADSLGMTCYNGGQDGNGILMQYGRWKMISKRHLPKVIIYDIEPAFDLCVDDNSRYIDRLKPFADENDVNEYIASLFPLERFKVLSHLYRYNYKYLEILSDCVRPTNNMRGYKPNNGHIRTEMLELNLNRQKEDIGPVDSVKWEYLNKLLSEAQQLDVKVVLVSSPYWKGYPDYNISSVVELAKYYGFLFLDYSDSEIRNNPDWFADSMHLNDEGAHAFTLDLINRILTSCEI